jgi:cell division septation protein DedD
MKKIALVSIVVASSLYSGNYPTQWSQPANVYANQSPSVQIQKQQIQQVYNQSPVQHKVVQQQTRVYQPQRQIVQQQVVRQTKVYRPQRTIMLKNGCPDCWNSYSSSLDIQIGKNFFQDNDNLDDAMIAGIRWNKCMTKNSFLQLGYERVFDASYENISRVSATSSSKNRATGATQVSKGEISFNRFYLNGMYEFTNYNKLYPYIFAGLGYEVVSEETSDIESQAFANAGLGLRYKLGSRYSIIGEGKAHKRLANGDLDYVATIGFGIAFGKKAQSIMPVRALHRNPVVHLPSVVPPRNAAIATPDYRYGQLQVQTPQPVIQMKQPVQQIQQVASGGAYYIQMGAFRKNYLQTAGSNYINRIQSSGLNYQIKQTMRNGKNMQLLLVGPYPSSDAARSDLHRAKGIVKGAFVKKIFG